MAEEETAVMNVQVNRCVVEFSEESSRLLADGVASKNDVSDARSCDYGPVSLKILSDLAVNPVIGESEPDCSSGSNVDVAVIGETVHSDNSDVPTPYLLTMTSNS